jgi:hypothetical protein
MIVNIPLIVMNVVQHFKTEVIISQDIFHQHMFCYVEFTHIFANTLYFCETQLCQWVNGKNSL